MLGGENTPSLGIEEEHIVEGPQLRQALSIFASHVVQHVADIHEHTNHAVLALGFARDEAAIDARLGEPRAQGITLLKVSQVRKDRNFAQRQVLRACKLREHIFADIVLQSQGGLVECRKMFRFYWQEPLTGKVTLYGAPPPLLRCVSPRNLL